MCFMNKIDKRYLKNRLSSINLNPYIKDNFSINAKSLKAKMLEIVPFLQKNYGKDGDCTLTSILTLVKYYNPKLNAIEVYDYIEKIAEKYLYNGNTYGTFTFFNKKITKEVFQHFGIAKDIVSRYGKGIGFNSKTIINQIDQKKPVIISITNDGRDYYKSHTITIIGYNIYKDEKGNQKVIFSVFDNWYISPSYLDYDALSIASMICY